MAPIDGSTLAFAREAVDLYDAILVAVRERYWVVMCIAENERFNDDDRMRCGIIATEIWKRALPDFRLRSPGTSGPGTATATNTPSPSAGNAAREPSAFGSGYFESASDAGPAGSSVPTDRRRW